METPVAPSPIPGILKAALTASVLVLAGPQPAHADPIHVPMQVAAAGTFYVEAQVTGLGAVDFLVDTGSGYTAIDQARLDTLAGKGEATFLRKLEGTLADGSTLVVPVYRISEIRLGSCRLEGVEAAVFGAGTRPILGMRDLQRVAPFTFSTNPPGISLGRCESPVQTAADVTTLHRR